MASFSLPPITDNPDGSWGPSSSNMPAEYKFKEIPYAPYSKSDKLGRFADWYDGAGDTRNPTVGAPAVQGTRSNINRGKRDAAQAYGSGTASAFAYFHVEDESSFSLVDSKATTVRRGGLVSRGRNQARGGYNTNTRGGQRGGSRGGFTPGRGGNQRGGGARRGWRDWDKVRNLSVDSFLPDDTVGRTIELENLLLLFLLHGRCLRRWR